MKKSRVKSKKRCVVEEESCVVEEESCVVKEESCVVKESYGITGEELSNVWLLLDGYVLHKEDRQTIVNGEFLSDKHINFAQALIRKQITKSVNGLLCTLQISRKRFSPFKEPAVQVIHT